MSTLHIDPIHKKNSKNPIDHAIAICAINKYAPENATYKPHAQKLNMHQ